MLCLSTKEIAKRSWRRSRSTDVAIAATTLPSFSVRAKKTKTEGVCGLFAASRARRTSGFCFGGTLRRAVAKKKKNVEKCIFFGEIFTSKSACITNDRGKHRSTAWLVRGTWIGLDSGYFGLHAKLRGRIFAKHDRRRRRGSTGTPLGCACA